MITQRLSGDVLQPYVTGVYVTEYYAAGQRLDYWVVPGVTHQSIVSPVRLWILS
jgi:hypothetical protein